MPSSFGLWFGAYAESLVDDMQMLVAAYQRSQPEPARISRRLRLIIPTRPREMTTRLLGFETMHYNVVAAQMSRGKTERAAAMAIASIASTLGHLAMDVCMWMCQNFGFISFPDELTTGSSIMPHQEEPRRVRDHARKMQPSAGHTQRDRPADRQSAARLQPRPPAAQRHHIPATTELRSCLEMADFMLQHIRVRADILDDPRYDYLFTVEDVNRLTLSGTPFREAYRTIGHQVQEGTYRPTREIHHTHAGSIGNLCNAEIALKMQRVLDRLA